LSANDVSIIIVDANTIELIHFIAHNVFCFAPVTGLEKQVYNIFLGFEVFKVFKFYIL